jgi:hypothetical protein
MDLVVLDNRVKRAYLEKTMLIGFREGKNSFVAFCNFCNKKLSGSIRISKNNLPYEIKVINAEFHHSDGNPENDVIENMKLYCYICHKNVHRWGIIQRWLERAGKNKDDLPDSKNLKPMTFRKY